MSSFPRSGGFSGGDVSGDARFLQDLEVDGNIGFYGTVPVVRPAAYNQAAYVATTRVNTAIQATQPAATGATSVAPFGYTTQAQADNINNSVRFLVNDVANVKQILNSVIDDLQTVGLLQ